MAVNRERTRSRRRPLTRIEMQQRTREDVLDSAEHLFLEFGFRDTTVAAIAAEAGRTQGAIYANFPSKESLCLAVLERRATGVLEEAMSQLSAAGTSIDDKIASLIETWRILSKDVGVTTLVAEYILATRNDEEQRDLIAGQIRIAKALIGSTLSASLDFALTPERTERAVMAVITTVSGLAFGQATNVIPESETVGILEDTLRAWFAALNAEQS